MSLSVVKLLKVTSVYFAMRYSDKLDKERSLSVSLALPTVV